MIALAILASLVGLSALLWYFYRLGEKAQRARVIQAQIDEIEGALQGAVEEIPDDFYRGMDPKKKLTLPEMLAMIELDETEKPNYSIEPN